MDVAIELIVTAFSVVFNFVVLILFYKIWILPYLTDLTLSLPAKVRECTEPFINEKIDAITQNFNDSIVELKGSFKATSSRLNRTMNQAETFLQGMDIDPDNDDEVADARATLTKRYGENVAIEAITRLFTSIANQNHQKTAQKTAIEAIRADGWD